ncbi:putative TOM core complex subunit Tom6 [Talaromyces proteolyticus]|uniref:TOM core complex subunit Tom6 n=1 Tax=Talaromyces proteolyticus TaxID=1131652 RepID=A0AAD4PWY3_9EURO|nr:putative TOM core complex subunit Tom6 [Talaromyces proteolyticus]KAH8692367.1 putative TOM core complex subunit Tom6 [Talaromyces proteolyticus]
MPPKRVVQPAGRGREADGIFNIAYKEVTNPENATIVRSVVIFGAAVAFFHSSLSEFLIPP